MSIQPSLKRYRCQACSKTFNALTGTPLARPRNREGWRTCAQAVAESAGIRKAAARSRAHSPGIAEADETFFLKFFKGMRKPDRAPGKRGGTAVKTGDAG
jgi:hypothetical protein